MANPKGLDLTAEHRAQLEKMVKSGMTPVDYVQRARILLLHADGLSSEKVAEMLNTRLCCKNGGATGEYDSIRLRIVPLSRHSRGISNGCRV